MGVARAAPLSKHMKTMQSVFLSKVFSGGLNQKCHRGGMLKRAEVGQTSRDFQKWSIQGDGSKICPFSHESESTVAVKDYLKSAARVVLIIRVNSVVVFVFSDVQQTLLSLYTVQNICTSYKVSVSVKQSVWKKLKRLFERSLWV